MTKIAIVAACAKFGVIGNKRRLPWNIPEDRLYFKELTMGSAVIFGRKTFEEIGKPLPGRINIVVSSQKNLVLPEGVLLAGSLEQAINIAEGLVSDFNPDSPAIFLCGGERIYKEGLILADFLYITYIDKEIKGDAYFPEIPEFFKETERKEIQSVDELKISFVTYRRS